MRVEITFLAKLENDAVHDEDDAASLAKSLADQLSAGGYGRPIQFSVEDVSIYTEEQVAVLDEGDNGEGSSEDAKPSPAPR